MPLTRSEFCSLYFSELERQGIPYVILHSYEAFPDQIGSDVDYAVLTRDLPRLVSLQRGLAESHGWRLAHAIEAHIYALYSVVADPENPPAFLQLDACGHYVEGGCFLLSDAALLENRGSLRGFSVPAPAVEFAYLLAKALAKGHLVAPRLPRLRELWQRDPESSETQFRNLFGPAAGSLRQWFDKPPTEWESLRPALLKRTRFSPGEKLREAFRAWKRILRPKGLHMALLGLDDSEVSALLDRAGPLIAAPIFRRQCRFDFPPGSFAYLAKYCAAALPAKVQNELIISAYSFDDLIIHPRRYRLPAVGSLARLLRRLLPGADLTIVLDAEPEQVLARKPGLSLEELRRRRAVLRQLAQDRRKYVLVSAGQPPNEMARAIYREAIRFLAERENRHG